MNFFYLFGFFEKKKNYKLNSAINKKATEFLKKVKKKEINTKKI